MEFKVVAFLPLFTLMFAVFANASPYEEKLEAVKFTEAGGDFCYREHNVPLELVFLIDRSSHLVLEQMPRIIQIIDDIKRTYNGTTFGLTFFSDFQCSDWDSYAACQVPNTLGDLHHTDPEGCYTFGDLLVDNLNRVKGQVQPGEVKYLSSGNSESALAAMYLAACDKRIQWTMSNQIRYDVKKIIFVVTDDTSHCCIKGPGTSNPLKGDGTDRCATMKNPTVQETAQKLVEKGISLFLLISRANTGILNFWKSTAKQLLVPYGMAQIEDFNAKVLENFHELVIDITLAQGRVMCGDPPAFNTLGL